MFSSVTTGGSRPKGSGTHSGLPCWLRKTFRGSDRWASLLLSARRSDLIPGGNGKWDFGRGKKPIFLIKIRIWSCAAPGSSCAPVRRCRAVRMGVPGSCLTLR